MFVLDLVVNEELGVYNEELKKTKTKTIDYFKTKTTAENRNNW